MEKSLISYEKPELEDELLQNVFFGEDSTCTVGAREDSETGTEIPVDEPDDPDI